MSSLPKSYVRLVRSLERKKHRERHNLYVAEGDKLVCEMLDSDSIVEHLFAKPAWLEALPPRLLAKAHRVVGVGDKELSQISFLKTPHQALALARMPDERPDMDEICEGLSLYLDEIQDPGNLGAIIRIADWFGIRHALCGEGCADPFSPKSVQSTMGAILRVKTAQTDESFFRQLKAHRPGFPVYGTFLNGESIYKSALPDKAVIVMGNESKGISAAVARHVAHRLLIPPFPPGKATCESLNVAMAAAVVCAEFRRG